jgi:type IV secretory pathway VirB10-like protein
MIDREVDAGPVADIASPMRLRAEPPRVTRLSRKVLLGLGGVAGLGLGGILIYALQSPKTGQGGAELFSTENRVIADQLADLPSDYSGPILGPPLPGDLGGPILAAQELGLPVVTPGLPGPSIDPEEQRRLAEEEAARTSAVFFQDGAGTAANLPVPVLPNFAGIGMAGPSGATAEEDRQLAFLTAPADPRTVAEDRIAAPASPFVLQAGSVIPAALVTGIRSDLPGQIAAQVTQHVYDSPTGRILLIPQGSRLIGEYDNAINTGQRRVLLVWTRLILPDGRSLVLERLPGADAAGYAGLQDRVDRHWWGVAQAAALSTLLNIGAEVATDDSDKLAAAFRDGAQDTIGAVAQEIVRQQLAIPPTLTIRPGFPLRVIVTRDLVLQPWRQE